MTGQVLIDTSALYALLDSDDPAHGRASSAWDRMLDPHEAAETPSPVTHSGIVIEVTAVTQHRLGMEAVRALSDSLLPVIEIIWVDAAQYGRAVSSLLAANRRSVSLVDWLSFEIMRARGIDTAFAFDDDFVEMGFSLWR